MKVFARIGLIIFFLFFSSLNTSNAQTPTVNPQNIINQIGDESSNYLFNIFRSNSVGVGCGQPESPNRTDGTKCCNLNLNTDQLKTKALESAPEFFCLPPGLSQAVGGAGGLLGAIGETIVDTVTKPIGAVVDLAQGKFGKAIGKFKDLVLPDEALKIVKAVTDSDKICLSDAAKLGFVSSLGLLPAQKLTAQDLPKQPCVEGAAPTTADSSDPSCKCVPLPDPGIATLCQRYVRGQGENSQCMACASGGGYWTGIGCIQADFEGFIASVFRVGLGIAGGFAFLCIIYAAFILQTSRGNPERIKKARQNLNSCLLGLGIIIFSVLLLRIVGVNILQIPGLN